MYQRSDLVNINGTDVDPLPKTKASFEKNPGKPRCTVISSNSINLTVQLSVQGRFYKPNCTAIFPFLDTMTV